MVAAHVHADTMAAAVSPVLITLPAVLNHSEVWDTPRYRSSTFVSIVITTAKTAPKPTTTNHPQLSSSTLPDMDAVAVAAASVAAASVAATSANAEPGMQAATATMAQAATAIVTVVAAVTVAVACSGDPGHLRVGGAATAERRMLQNRPLIMGRLVPISI